MMSWACTLIQYLRKKPSTTNVSQNSLDDHNPTADTVEANSMYRHHPDYSCCNAFEQSMPSSELSSYEKNRHSSKHHAKVCLNSDPICFGHAEVFPLKKSNRRAQSCDNFFIILAESITQEHLVTAKDVMYLIPLQFKAPEMEETFFKYLVSVRPLRHRLPRALAYFFFTVIWLFFLIFPPHDIPFPDKSRFVIVSLQFTFLILVLSCATYFFALPYLTSLVHFERFLCYSMGLETSLPTCWSLINIIRFRVLNTTSGSQIQSNMYKFKLWTAPLALGIPLCNALLFNFFTMSRTRSTFLPQLVTVLALSAMNLVQAGIATSVSAQGQDENITSSFFIVAAGFESISLIIIFAITYMARWSIELRERIEFCRLRSARHPLKNTEDIDPSIPAQGTHSRLGRRQKKCQSNAAEDLLHLVIRATTSIQATQNTTHDEALEKSTQLLKELQKALTSTENLYAVNVTEENAVACVQESTNEPLDCSQLEAQLLDIYAHHKTYNKQNLSSQGSGVQNPHMGYRQQMSDDVTNAKCSTPMSNQQNFPTIQSLAQLTPYPNAKTNFHHFVGRDWNWNILETSNDFPNLLMEVGSLILLPKSTYLQTSPTHIRNYVYHLQRLYSPNPFHNAVHSAMVTHSLWCLLRMLRIDTSPVFTTLDSVAVTIASLGHDVGHPGRNNQFFLNTFQKMALLYNDHSALENYHCALVFKCLEFDSSDIFEALDIEDKRKVRKKIIDLILTTDMGEHFKSLSNFRLRRLAEDFNFITESSHMWRVIGLCIKCADLSHVLIDWDQHYKWELRLAEEHYQQGANEEKLGLHTLPLYDRTQHHNFPKSRKNFIDFIVFPMMIQMEDLQPTREITDNCVRRAIYNKRKWEELDEKNETIEIPEYIRKMRTYPSVCRTLMCHLLVPKGYELAPCHSGSQTSQGNFSPASTLPPDNQEN